MKTWVMVCILALGISAIQTGAQTTPPTFTPPAFTPPPTNLIPPVPTHNGTSAPTGKQIPTMAPTNPSPAISTNAIQGGSTAAPQQNTVAPAQQLPQSQLGAPPMPTTNPNFGNAFVHTNIISPQTTTATTPGNSFPSASSQPTLGASSLPATNPNFGNVFVRTNNLTPQATTAIITNPLPAVPSQTQLGVPSTAATPTNSFAANPTNPLQAATMLQSSQTVIGAQLAITNFLFVSSAQSFIGQGQGLFATATNGYNVTMTQFGPNNIQFNISPTNSAGSNWFLQFTDTNDFFGVGVYSNAVSAGQGPTRLLFSGMARGNNTSDGSFNVLEATYSSNQLVSFAADFIQYDNNDTNSWNEGSIRYNSTIPDSVNLLLAPVAMSFQDGNPVLTWSTNLVGFQLEYATNVPGTWFTNNSVPAIVDGHYSVTVTNGGSAGSGTGAETGAGMHFFRLMKPL